MKRNQFSCDSRKFLLTKSRLKTVKPHYLKCTKSRLFTTAFSDLKIDKGVQEYHPLEAPLCNTRPILPVNGYLLRNSNL